MRRVADAVLAAAGRQAVDVEAIRNVASDLRYIASTRLCPEPYSTYADTLESAIAPAQSASEGKRAR